VESHLCPSVPALYSGKYDSKQIEGMVKGVFAKKIFNTDFSTVRERCIWDGVVNEGEPEGQNRLK